MFPMPIFLILNAGAFSNYLKGCLHSKILMKAASFVQTIETITVTPRALVAMLWGDSSQRIGVNMIIINFGRNSY
jgi:hypothetical protein